MRTATVSSPRPMGRTRTSSRSIARCRPTSRDCSKAIRACCSRRTRTSSVSSAIRRARTGAPHRAAVSRTVSDLEFALEGVVRESPRRLTVRARRCLVPGDLAAAVRRQRGFHIIFLRRAAHFNRLLLRSKHPYSDDDCFYRRRRRHGRVDTQWLNSNRGPGMTVETLIVWLIVGAIAGWLAGQVMKGGGFGLIGDIILGIVGALVAGWLLPQLGILIGGGTLGAIINAFIGACIVLFVVRLIKRA